jgi:hypothetical protein
MAMHDYADDEDNRRCIRSAYDMIQQFVDLASSHMGPGGRADLIDLALETIGETAQRAQRYSWPDLEARALADARQDKSLQKLLKRVSRKTPI